MFQFQMCPGLARQDSGDNDKPLINSAISVNYLAQCYYLASEIQGIEPDRYHLDRNFVL